jgi:hypothetical protein
MNSLIKEGVFRGSFELEIIKELGDNVELFYKYKLISLDSKFQSWQRL